MSQAPKAYRLSLSETPEVKYKDVPSPEVIVSTSSMSVTGTSPVLVTVTVYRSGHQLLTRRSIINQLSRLVTVIDANKSVFTTVDPDPKSCRLDHH